MPDSELKRNSIRRRPHRIRPLKKRRYTIVDSLYFSFAGAPIAAGIRLLNAVIQGIIPSLTALVTASFVDTAMSILREYVDSRAIDYGEGMLRLLTPIISILLITAFNMLNSEVNGLSMVRIINGNRSWLRPRLMEKRGRLDYKCIEDTDDWNLIQRVFTPAFDTKTPEETMYQTFLTFISAGSTILTFISVISLITTEVWWAGIGITATCVPLIFISLKGGKKIYDESALATEDRRRAQYYSEIMANRENTAERAVFGYTDALSNDYDAAMKKALDARFNVSKKTYRSMNTNSIALTVAGGIASIVLLIATLRGDVSPGMFIALAGAIATIIQAMRWQISWLAERLARYTGYMKDVTAFIAMPEQERAIEPPDRSIEAFKSLEFKAVYFRYPKSDKYILNGTSFRIERGKHYSFVGANGAGKTTVTKLLLGLYRDYEGQILLNGKELHEYSLGELKGYFICVFQDLAKYQVELDKSIMLGDVSSWQDGKSMRDDRLYEAVRLSGLKSLTDRIGLDAHIGKVESDGVDISGGEWQRVAMARAIYSPSEIKILDEPTAALDPIAEAGAYQNFRDISQGRTAIFISHRLGSTKLADTIFVLDEGRVVESGAHDQLMELGGLYAEMYDSQRSWYA